MTEKRMCPNCGQMVLNADGICPNCDKFSASKETRRPIENVEETQALSEDKNNHAKSNHADDVSLEKKSNEKEPENMKKFAPAAAILDKEKEKGNTSDASTTEEVNKTTDSENAATPTDSTNDSVTEKTDVTEEAATVAQASTTSTEEKATTTDVPKEELFSNITPPNGEEPPKKGSSFGKKAAIGVAAVLLALGAGYGYTKYEESAKEKDQAKVEKSMALAENHIDQLYLNEQKVFLSKNFDMTKLTNVSNEIAEIKDEKTKEDLTKQLDVVSAKADKQGEINNLFQSPAISGDQLADKVMIKSDLAKIPAAIEKPADDFDKLYNKAIDTAKKQFDKISEVKKAMAKIIDKDGKAVKGLTSEDYEAAKKLVASLSDKDLKEKLTKQLEVAEKALKNADKSDAKDTNKTTDKANQESNTNNNNNANNNDANAANNNDSAASNNDTTNNNGSANNSNNNSVAGGGTLDHGANDDGGALVKDGVVIHGRTPGSTLEGDWSWAPGVQDNFINTAISRGYVTAGGYELRAKEIINGEAYYELYATRRDTALTQGFSDSQLPIYLVTVNAKTGSFRGGASNYSDAK